MQKQFQHKFNKYYLGVIHRLLDNFPEICQLNVKTICTSQKEKEFVYFLIFSCSKYIPLFELRELELGIRRLCSMQTNKYMISFLKLTHQGQMKFLYTSSTKDFFYSLDSAKRNKIIYDESFSFGASILNVDFQNKQAKSRKLHKLEKISALDALPMAS